MRLAYTHRSPLRGEAIPFVQSRMHASLTMHNGRGKPRVYDPYGSGARPSARLFELHWDSAWPGLCVCAAGLQCLCLIRRARESHPSIWTLRVRPGYLWRRVAGTLASSLQFFRSPPLSTLGKASHTTCPSTSHAHVSKREDSNGHRQFPVLNVPRFSSSQNELPPHAGVNGADSTGVSPLMRAAQG